MSSETRGENPVAPAGESKQVWQPADAAQLGAEADGQRIPPRLFHVVEHVLAVGIAVGILDGRVHPGEHAESVEAALDFGDGGGGERVAGIQRDVPVDEPRAGHAVPADQHLAHELLPALVHHEAQVHLVRLGGGRVAPLEGGVGEIPSRNIAPGWCRGPRRR